MDQLTAADNARSELKNELNAANEKIIALEEELYEAKSTQAEMLD